MLRIAHAVDATLAPTTRQVYEQAWRTWQRWCVDRSVPSLPATPATVAAYLTERADAGKSIATVEQTCSAISAHHRHHDLTDPIDSELVRMVRRGLRRIVGRTPRRPAHPLTVEEIRRIVTSIDRTTARGGRDVALILLGFAGALRRSELATLALDDVNVTHEGLRLHLRRSKTDQEGLGQIIGIARGDHQETDPVLALQAWLAVRGLHRGPLLCSLRHRRPPHIALRADSVSRIVTERAEEAGLDTATNHERISGHSLRAGHATSAAAAGVSVDRIAAQTRHRRIDILIDRYIRPAQALTQSSSNDLGL